jgi:hypothetical protein
MLAKLKYLCTSHAVHLLDIPPSPYSSAQRHGEKSARLEQWRMESYSMSMITLKSRPRDWIASRISLKDFDMSNDYVLVLSKLCRPRA